MKSEHIYEQVEKQIKVFESAGDRKVFTRLSHFRRSVYGIRICFEIMSLYFNTDENVEDVPQKKRHSIIIFEVPSQ